MKALVTAGGTVQHIDDVRTMGNISTGSFGVAIARMLAAKGIETTLLGSQVCVDRLGRREPFAVQSFVDFYELQAGIEDYIRASSPDLIFMAAAVSDYAPQKSEGKIRSDAESLTIEMERLPKILPTLREQAGSKCFIAGFKLLSGVSEQELVSVALGQVGSARLNLSVANDSTQVFSGLSHPVKLVTAEGGVYPLDGPKELVAGSLVEFCLRRHNTRWFSTVQEDNSVPSAEPLGRLVRFAQDANLLTNTSGNVSKLVSRDDQRIKLLVTPRGKNKAEIAEQDFCLATVDLVNRHISYQGVHKSSIDTGVQAIMYDHLPNIDCMIHFHPGTALVLPDYTTSETMPCETVEEACTVLQALSGYRGGGSFMVELTKHGYVLCLSDAEELFSSWENVLEGHNEHLRSIGQFERVGELLRAPIFMGPQIIGVVGYLDDGSATLWLPREFRGEGAGRLLLEQVIERRLRIAAHDNCAVSEFYQARGFVEESRTGGIVTLLPPTLNEDVIEAATVTLVHRESSTMLIGERKTEPWLGYFAFPGGRLEKGETPQRAAERELLEEAGICIHIGETQPANLVYTGENGRVYKIWNYVIPVWTRHQPKPSSEIDCSWRSTSEVLRTGVATRQIIRMLK